MTQTRLNEASLRDQLMCTEYGDAGRRKKETYTTKTTVLPENDPPYEGNELARTRRDLRRRVGRMRLCNGR